jgi:hypothetical protein
VNEAGFEEASAIDRISRLPLSHLSVELGHVYMEDLDPGGENLRRLMQTVAPWAATARRVCETQLNLKNPRISTCFLVDDYFTELISPRELIPQLVGAASACGLQLDYLARESACVEADGTELARLVQDRLVPDPPPSTNGSRPPPSTSGWLCNGERGPQPAAGEAMRKPKWRPPSENGANRHSIFLDVQLWNDSGDQRVWSCPYLAAIWQLLRLGVLRHGGKPITQPKRFEKDFPASWKDMPPITQLTDRPAPFSAYRTFSVMPKRFFPIEDAVRVILSQFDVGQAIRTQMNERAADERSSPINLPAELNDRVEYVFTGQPWSLTPQAAA